MKTTNYKFLLLLGALLFSANAFGQHTLGFTAGYGMASGRMDPKVESQAQWGIYTGGLTWRYYGTQRFVGGFGVDLEFIQQGYSFATNGSVVENKADFLFYSRKINSVMLPIVWQPHFYMLRNHVRIYLEAAVTFSYNFSSTYKNEEAKQEGTYNFKLVRDNRWGYGLAGGGGIAVLIKRYELNFRARYYFGLSDIVRNRNRYSGNATDGAENPFVATPMRSPLDNLTISVGLSYRFNKSGFETWKPREKKEKNKEVFKYAF